MGFDVKDLVGFSEPAKKLIEVVSAGIGTIFRPTSIRKGAEAKSYELQAIAEAEAKTEVTKSVAKTRAELARIELLAGGNQEVIERARLRLLAREIEGQQNTEAIAENALSMLPATVSEKPVSEDWRRKFFLEAENICDKDLQLLWAKILAGEVTSPGSYSLRTLEVLKHISKEEAESFRLACNLAFNDGWIMKPGHDMNAVLAPYGIDYGQILTLRDAGLLVEGDTLVKQYKSVSTSIILSNNGVVLQISGPTIQNQQLPAIPFTRAGRELQNLIQISPCMPYLQAVATYFRSHGLAVKKGELIATEACQSWTFDQDFS